MNEAHDFDTREARPTTSLADQIVDDLVPGDLDWRRLVTSYPLTSVAVATLGGFFLGRHHGKTLVGALSAFAVREVSNNVLSAIGDPGVAGT